ncbi:MAG TPA: APC family permease [Iamia sp.]|nr:APC family permease [Iamia sp.]
MASTLKRALVGRPLASSDEEHQRLGKPTALAVFASDAISSTAYATQEMLFILMGAVMFPASHRYLVPIAVAAVVLLAIVAISYSQTIHAYPNGGGAYIVSRENISPLAGLVAGAALLVDYTLTVAVSISAGVLAIGSAFHFNDEPALRVALALGFLAVLTIGNLRGVKESGKVFAVPTYFYVVLLGALLVVGLGKVFLGGDDSTIATERSREVVAEIAEESDLSETAGLFILLKAFSSGAVVLSGVEAISNGVPAFRKPESRHASQTLGLMAAILATGFLGISVLAHHYRPVVDEEGQTVLAQLAAAVFGDGSVLFYGLQLGTFAILILAANTAYADFPRLSSIIARDGYLPRQLATRGDRLVFSNGILILAGMAGVLITVFRAEVTLLIPLYAVGVFTGFTLSQAGMVRHHLRLREPRWPRGLAINVVGCIATGVVLVVVVSSKFTDGAWIPAVVIPVIVVGFRAIHRHYATVDRALAVPEGYRARRRTHTVVVLVGRVTKGSLEAIAYARSLNPDRLLAVTVVADAEQQDAITRAWADHEVPVELRTLYSPYRELSRPIMRFVEEYDSEVSDDFLTVVLPEFVLDHWWAQVLHNQSALVLRTRLRARPDTVVTSVPFHLHEGRVGIGGTG